MYLLTTYAARTGRMSRRLLAMSLMGALAMLALPALANADTSTSLTVIGTSDVSDSGLMQNVIEPAFHAAYPSFTFKYIGTATGTAINDAESGTDGPSVLLVHAASLENQFVAGGYSYDDQYGHAVFSNDFVLAGPSSDPAGVGTGGAHNIAQAFADVAASGISGDAEFVSRGGSSGTTVEEHQIWALVANNDLAPNGLLLCTLSSANGGGDVPIASGQGVTAVGQQCPGSGALPTGSELPSWYATTGLTQGPNVVAANACTGYSSGANSCYVLTDRGTFDYLSSGLDPAGTIPNLTILTRNDSSTAPGGADALINYFHAYVINPSSNNEAVDLPAAQDFVNLLTSPALQSQLQYYLDDTSDSGGAPFVADASPAITSTGIPTTDDAGLPVTVTGTVTNEETGYPALSGVTVNVEEVIAGVPQIVASGTTGSDGSYSITFTPTSSGAYEVTTPQLSQVENSTLSPVFGDILSPGSSTPTELTMIGLSVAHSLSFKSLKVSGETVTAGGTLSPAPALSGAKVELLAAKSTSSGGLKVVGTATLKAGTSTSTFSIKAKLKGKGKWLLQLYYVQKGQTSTYSGLKTASIK